MGSGDERRLRTRDLRALLLVGKYPMGSGDAAIKARAIIASSESENTQWEVAIETPLLSPVRARVGKYPMGSGD